MVEHSRFAAWPLSADEIELYTTGGCFLLAWALDQVASEKGISTGEIVLSWMRSIDDRHALHAAYITAAGKVIDATGVQSLVEYLALYSNDGWDSTVVPARLLEEDGYVFPEDVAPHVEAVEVARRLSVYL